jgi:energy-coupling factor transport system permease protein
VSALAPLAPDAEARLASVNPVAKLGAAIVVLLGLVVTSDPLTPSLLLGLELVALPFTGVRPGTLMRRTWPLLVSVGGVAITNAIVVDGGRVLLDLGLFDVTARGVETAVAVWLRLLAITLPGIVVLATTDPMDMADALVQRWHAPARFAYGALAALRLLPLLAADWAMIGRARRARGLDAGRSPVRRLRLFASQTFAVLVAAIRRGVRLATAMEARGFDAGRARSVARPQPLRARDWAVLGGTLVAVLLATAVSVAAGSWSLAFGG